MGYELKMVPLDFDWPMGFKWEGFVNPHYDHREQCPFCSGCGYNQQTQKISDNYYRGHTWCKTITQDEFDFLVERKVISWPATHTTVDDYNNNGGWADCASAQYLLTKKRAEYLGVCGDCLHCGGDGTIWRTPEYKAKCNAWEATELPKGPGYQIWETVSEGSPISPVFRRTEDLAVWMFDHNEKNVTEGVTYEDWLKFINGPGWAPSIIIDARPGVQK